MENKSVKRLTKEETIKALECCCKAVDTELCDTNCPLFDVTDNATECNSILRLNSLIHLKFGNVEK